MEYDILYQTYTKAAQAKLENTWSSKTPWKIQNTKPYKNQKKHEWGKHDR